MGSQLIILIKKLVKYVAFVLFMSSFGIAYFYYKCSDILPDNSMPSSTIYPEVARNLLRASYTYHLSDLSPGSIDLEPESYIVSSGARILLRRNSAEKASRIERNWKQNYQIARSWVYWNWNETEILNTILDESIYGREWRGISVASREFFGVEVADLKTEEIAVLVANTKSNSNYDPWCNQEEVYAEASRLLKEYAQIKQVTFVQVDSGAMFARLKQRSASCTN